MTVTDRRRPHLATAIVARSLDIPAAVGVHNASTLIRQDDIVVIDGDAWHRRRSEHVHPRGIPPSPQRGELQASLEQHAHTPTVTLDSTHKSICRRTSKCRRMRPLAVQQILPWAWA
ncbi:PEP-utilizing enzyme [Cupriavidus basilensis]